MPTVNGLVAAGRYMSPEDLMVGAQWLRVLAVLPKDLGSIPSTQILAHNLTPVLEDLILSSGLPMKCITHALWAKYLSLKQN